MRRRLEAVEEDAGSGETGDPRGERGGGLMNSSPGESPPEDRLDESRLKTEGGLPPHAQFKKWGYLQLVHEH